MKACLTCPKDDKCRGYILHGFVLKLFDAAKQGLTNTEEIVNTFSREEMRALATVGNDARTTCWSKAYRMAVSHRLSELVAKHADEKRMRAALRELVQHLDATFARLPQGISVDPNDIIMDIYNMTTEEMKITGQTAFIPAHVRTMLAKELPLARQAKIV